jgi:hypothetical protein
MNTKELTLRCLERFAGSARFVLAAAIVTFATMASAQDKPNIIVIWGDDIGESNISAYNFGRHCQSKFVYFANNVRSGFRGH